MSKKILKKPVKKNKPEKVKVIKKDAIIKKEPKEKKDLYRIIVKINSKRYEESGKTVLECVKKLKPLKFYKTKCVIRIEKGKVNHEKIILSLRYKKIVESTDLFKIIYSKNLAILLGE